LGARVFTFVNNVKSSNGIVVKEIFQNHFCLALAVTVAFLRQGDLNRIIKIFGYPGGITGFECLHNILHAIRKCERRKQGYYAQECKKSFHNF
jgi:hypothetical protein